MKLKNAPLVLAGEATPEQLAEIGFDGVEAIKTSGDAINLRSCVAYDYKLDQVAERSYRFVWSSEATDHAGDILTAKGWDFSVFKRNPQALWAHNAGLDTPMPGIGLGSKWKKGVDVKATKGGTVKGLDGVITLAEAGTSTFIDMLDSLVQQTIVRATSVGFRYLATKKYENADERLAAGLGPFGVHGLKQLLLEISLVPIGMNSDALSRGVDFAVSKGLVARDGAPDAVRLIGPCEDELEFEGRADVIESLLADLDRKLIAPAASASDQQWAELKGSLLAAGGADDEGDAEGESAEKSQGEAEESELTPAELKADAEKVLEELAETEADAEEPEEAAVEMRSIDVPAEVLEQPGVSFCAVSNQLGGTTGGNPIWIGETSDNTGGFDWHPFPEPKAVPFTYPFTIKTADDLRVEELEKQLAELREVARKQAQAIGTLADSLERLTSKSRATDSDDPEEDHDADPEAKSIDGKADIVRRIESALERAGL